ncbi:MAG: tRNA (N(6)-L-threonylcarbamoyladenosine(37)-C(2))-methylthiotransferase MtaB [Candidatus Omnitrophota bacterium]
MNKAIKKTCAFYTFGCKVNQYETQFIREQFLKQGFVETKEKPAYYIVNGCTVTSAADRKCRYLLRSLHKKNPQAKIIITGCFAKNNPNIKKQNMGISQVIEPGQKSMLIDIAQNNINDRIIDPLAKDKKLNSLRKEMITDFQAHSRAFVKVQDGCDNFCSYCIVPYMRGLPMSRAIKVIIKEVTGLVNKGFKEIVLTGINLGMWGSESGKVNGKLPELINQLVKIKQLKRLRLSSVEFAHVDDLLIEQFKKSKKICAHLHIPLQSGDDDILKKMNRRYNRVLFLNRINQIKQAIPRICFTTDIMVGFPGETEENLNNTIDIVKKAGFLKVHIFPFSPRPGTPAARMPEQIDKKIKDKYKKNLAEISKQTSFEVRKKLLNTKLIVLFEELSKDGYWMGYSDNYVQIKLKSAQNLKNLILPIKISRVTADDTIGILA